MSLSTQEQSKRVIESSSTQQRSKRVREWVFCDHCKKEVSHATFYRHKCLHNQEDYEDDSCPEEILEDDNLSDLLSSNKDQDSDAYSEELSSEDSNLLDSNENGTNASDHEELYNDSLAYNEPEGLHKTEMQVHQCRVDSSYNTLSTLMYPVSKLKI